MFSCHSISLSFNCWNPRGLSLSGLFTVFVARRPSFWMARDSKPPPPVVFYSCHPDWFQVTSLEPIQLPKCVSAKDLNSPCFRISNLQFLNSKRTSRNKRKSQASCVSVLSFQFWKRKQQNWSHLLLSSAYPPLTFETNLTFTGFFNMFISKRLRHNR